MIGPASASFSAKYNDRRIVANRRSSFVNKFEIAEAILYGLEIADWRKNGTYSQRDSFQAVSLKFDRIFFHFLTTYRTFFRNLPIFHT